MYIYFFITVTDSSNFNRVLSFWSKYNRNVEKLLFDLKFHAILQSSGTITQNILNILLKHINV